MNKLQNYFDQEIVSLSANDLLLIIQAKGLNIILVKIVSEPYS